MIDWVTFESEVTPMEWGRATYTVIRVPDDAVAALGATRRVEGEIAEYPVNLALTRAPAIEGVFLWAGQSLLDRIGVAPGERVELRLRPAPDDRVDTPPEVEAALRGTGLLPAWGALTPGRRRGLLHKISTARTDATREKRIAALVVELSG